MNSCNFHSACTAVLLVCLAISYFLCPWRTPALSDATPCWPWSRCCGSQPHNLWPWPSAWRGCMSGTPLGWAVVTRAWGCSQLQATDWAMKGFPSPASCPSMAPGWCLAPCPCWTKPTAWPRSPWQHSAPPPGPAASSVGASLLCGSGTTPTRVNTPFKMLCISK